MPSITKRLIAFLILIPVPWLALVIGGSMLWYGLTKWIYDLRPIQWVKDRIDNGVKRLGKKMLQDERDYQYLYSSLGLAIYMPALFIGSFYYQTQIATEFNWLAVLGYQILNYGPYFLFFSQVATLIHKEGHAAKGLFKPQYRIFNNIHGFLMGIFCGHVPQAYPVGHLGIHHRHDNDFEDVTTTLPYERNEAMAFMYYLYDFALFWTGISVVQYFRKKKMDKGAQKMLSGMAIFYGLIAVFLVVHPLFALGYLILPHLSAIIFLAAINYCWHAFADPAYPDDPYRCTLTILKGHYNVYNEDYHLEHHLRPLAHWTEYPKNFEKYQEEYKAKNSVVLEDTQAFEVFFWILFKRYDLIAQHKINYSGETEEESIEQIKYLLSRKAVAYA